MKNTYTQEELDQIAHGAYKAYDHMCQNIEESVNDTLEIDYDDFNDESKEELINNLKDYTYPWVDYETRMNALNWLKENNYITE